jgi:O-antigen ligase/tetratricopeptide (TPR) repeat protein
VNKKIKKQEFKDRNITIYILLISILGFFLISPYQQGLFNGGRMNFEKPIYYTVLFSCIVLVISCCYLMFKKVQLNRMALITIGVVCMLPVTYAISYVNAVTPHYALDALMISWVWLSFFIVSLIINRTIVSRDLMVHGIMLASYVLVLGGFLNWFGQVEWKDAVLFGRLSNVFQYPNTYAIFLMSIFFSQMYLVTHNEKTSRLILIFHKLMIVPVLVSFLLTLSRGALIVLPIMVIIYLIFCTVERQIKFLLYSIITFILALILIGPLTRIRTELVYELEKGPSLQGWFILLITALLGGLMIWLIEWCWRRIKLPNFIAQFIQFQWILPIIILLLTIVTAFLIFTESPFLKVLPDVLENKVKTIDLDTENSTQRFIYYQDAWKIFKDYPVFGAGGGGWSKLYAEYQSYPYIGNQAHSFYLQTLNETGLIGLLILLILVVIIYYMYTKHYFKERILDNRHVYLLFATPILIHSFLDFHMTFVYIAALVFFSLGGMVSNLIQGSHRNQPKQSIIAKNVLGGIMLTGSIVFIVMTFRFIDASNEYEKAYKQQSYEPLARALELRPNHPDLVNLAVQSLLGQFDNTKELKLLEQASDLVEQQRDIEPRNTNAIELQGEVLERQNKAIDALDTYEKIIEMTPWSTRGYEKTIDLQYRMGEADPQWWDKAIKRYMDFIESIEELKEKNQYTASMFNMLDIETRIAQIYYQRGQYLQSSELLKKYTDTIYLSTPEYQTAIRWYLASTIKSGIKDTLIYDQFILNFPTENDEINHLLNNETLNR